MTQETLNEIADVLEAKAESVADGNYGNAEPGEDESWIGDLTHAAYLLREGRVDDLNQVEWDEIEACSEYNREDFEEHEGKVWCSICMQHEDKETACRSHTDEQ